MGFVRGDSCYILDQEKRVEFAKVVGRKGSQYLLQRIGACGTVLRHGDEMFHSEEEALQNKKHIPPKIKVQISE